MRNARRLLLILTISSVVAACGGGQHATTVTSTTTAAPTHLAPAASCTPGNTTMQCILAGQPAPPRLFSLTPGSLYGVDYGWSGLSVNTLLSIHARFAASYFSHDPSKNWTLSAVHALHAAGIATVGVWETGATRAEDGYAAGVSDAHEASMQAAAVGNTDRPITFAVDCDCPGAAILGYFQGVHSVLGARGNAYGGYYQLLYLFQHGVVGHANWQTYAWSRGLWLPASVAPLEQYLNGNAFDNDRAISPDYGQWPGPQAGPTSAQKAKWRKGRDASFRVWAGAAYSPVWGSPGHDCSKTLTNARCWLFSHRVEYFQRRLGREHCFGPHAAKRRYLCRVVRPIVSNQSKRRATLRADSQSPVGFGGPRCQSHRGRCAYDRREIARLNRLIHQEVF